MKTIVTFLLLLDPFLKVIATEQEPDKLIYDKLTLTLQTGWGHPSPLQTYFYQTNIAYPFKELSTGNYRGHIATWVIQKDRFYLKDIDVNGKIHSPSKYGVKPKSDSYAIINLIFADWFSGIIECNKTDEKDRWKTISTFYFQIRNGEIISMSEITKENLERLNKFPDKDTWDNDLMTKYKLRFLNQNYITYYYRLNESDVVEYNNRHCRLNTGVSRLSPIYSLYSNQHLNWPYNWENLEKCGAPHCRWKISNDSLILIGLQLYSGLRFDSIAKETIELDSLLPGRIDNKQIFADWVTGIQLIIYGIDRTDGIGFTEFIPKEYTYCRLEKGIVKESYSMPFSYDMKKNENSLDPRLKKLMDSY